MTKDEIIEAMARAIHAEVSSHRGSPHPWPPKGLDKQWLAEGAASLAALEAATPGLADVLDGKASIVPNEATSTMIRDGVSYRLSTSLGGDNRWPEDTQRLYAAMLAATPYRRPTDDRHD